MNATARRHGRNQKPKIELALTTPAVRRLARRGGVKRLSGLVYEETRGAAEVFLQKIIQDAVTYTQHARRKTVTSLDVVRALKRSNRTLYGYDEPPVRWVRPSFNVQRLVQLTPREEALAEQLRVALAEKTIERIDVPRNTTGSTPLDPQSLKRLGLGDPEHVLRGGNTGVRYYLNDDAIGAYMMILRQMDKTNAYLKVTDFPRKPPTAAAPARAAAASSAAAADNSDSDIEVIPLPTQPYDYKQAIGEAARKILRQFPEIHKKERVFLPVNVGGCHWVVYAILPKRFTIEVYDSLNGGLQAQSIQETLQMTKDVVNEIFHRLQVPVDGNHEWKVVDKSPVPSIQLDGVTCGAYVSVVAHAVGMSRGKADLTVLRGQGERIRKKMAAMFMKYGNVVRRVT